MMANLIRILAATVAFAALLTLGPAVASAGCEDDAQGSGGEKKQAFHIEERNGEKVYVIDEAIAVCGKVPRPSVVYVLHARTINYEWETLKQDFLPRIVDAVKRNPF